jgi:hypothetical protein
VLIDNGEKALTKAITEICVKLLKVYMKISGSKTNSVTV